MKLISKLLPLLLLVPACDGLVDPGYRGEPLAEIRGQVSRADTDPPVDNAIVVLAWHDEYRVIHREQVEVERTGLAYDFKLKLYAPPPEKALQDLGGDNPRFALGTVMLWPAGAKIEVPEDNDWVNLCAITDTAPLGAAMAQMVLYLEDDAVEGSATATVLGAALPAGYHLLTYDRTDRFAAERNACSDQVQRDVVARYPQFCELHPLITYAQCRSDVNFLDCVQQANTCVPQPAQSAAALCRPHPAYLAPSAGDLNDPVSIELLDGPGVCFGGRPEEQIPHVRLLGVLDQVRLRLRLGE